MLELTERSALLTFQVTLLFEDLVTLKVCLLLKIGFKELSWSKENFGRNKGMLSFLDKFVLGYNFLYLINLYLIAISVFY